MHNLVMDLCLGGDLHQWWYGKFELAFGGKRMYCTPEAKTTASICDQMLTAVRYLHSFKIMHRDLKLLNFVLDCPDAEDKPPQLKLIDFGCAVEFPKGQVFTDALGTNEYLAPEML